MTQQVSGAGRGLRRLEGIWLLLAAPVLIFPDLAPVLVAPLIGGLALLWLVQRWRLGTPIWPDTPFTRVMWLWTAAVIVGILVSAEPALTLPKATNLCLGLATWRYLSLVITNRRALAWGVALYLAVGAAFVAGGVLGADWSFKISWVEKIVAALPWQTLHLPGSPAVGVHTNQLAGTLVLYLPCVVCLWLGWRPARARWLVWLLGLAAAVALIFWLALSQSRSGWLAALAGLALLALARISLIARPSLRRAVWVGLAVCLLAAGWSLARLNPDLLARLWTEPPRETVVGSLTSLAFRREVWHWATVAIADFPITGVGLGVFRHMVHRLYLTQIPVGYDFGHAHNMFLQVALDVGLPGLVAYLALLIVALLSGGWVFRHDPAGRPLALGLAVGLVALHIYGLTDAIAPGAKNGLSLWLALALLGALRRLSAAPPAVQA